MYDDKNGEKMTQKVTFHKRCWKGEGYYALKTILLRKWDSLKTQLEQQIFTALMLSFWINYT